MHISLSTAYKFVCLLEKCEICQYANYAQVKTSKITGKISSLTRYGKLRDTTLEAQRENNLRAQIPVPHDNYL